jgi:hypothetical protein
MLFCCAAKIQAQQTKPQFKYLTYITYETTASKEVIINDIVIVDATGKAHYKSVWYNGIADTTYQLSVIKIQQLNRVFNGSKPLRDYMDRTELPKGSHFGGSYSYASYIDNHGKTENFTVVSPFMSADFNDALSALIIMPSKIAYPGKTINNAVLSKQILLSEKRSKYLPKIEEPPSVMEPKSY